ncbi:TPA: oligosaccharide flippase family protein [Morganella morganii]|nr:oligosaccharide flippase family protein [Morganella morganii]
MNLDINKVKAMISLFIKKLSGMYLLQISNYIFPLILIPILIKKLSLGGYGDIIYATTLVQIFGMVIDFGFTYTCPVETTKLQNKKELLGAYYLRITLLKLAIYILSMTILMLIMDILKINDTTVILISIILLGNVFFPIWLFQGLSLFNQVSIIQISTKVIFLISLILLIYLLNIKNNLLIIFLMSGNLLVSLLLSIKKISRLISFKDLGQLSFKACYQDLKIASNVFISVLGSIGYNSLIPIILGKYLGSSSLAVYSILQKMTAACQSMILPISQFMLTNISISINNKTNFKQIITKSIKLHLSFSVLGAIAYITLGQFVSNLLGYKAPLDLILISSLILIFSSLNNVLGIQTMIPLKKTNILRVINLFSGIFTALISVYIINTMGVFGGVFLNLLGEALVFTSLTYWHIKNINIYE